MTDNMYTLIMVGVIALVTMALRFLPSVISSISLAVYVPIVLIGSMANALRTRIISSDVSIFAKIALKSSSLFVRCCFKFLPSQKISSNLR